MRPGGMWLHGYLVMDARTVDALWIQLLMLCMHESQQSQSKGRQIAATAGLVCCRLPSTVPGVAYSRTTWQCPHHLLVPNGAVPQRLHCRALLH